ncbi:aspartate/glutamate racemase family protein [Kaistella carnis]|uniref:aspartate/glutamate racemase family protein n=1 Tax=Kaistella carnis TaxID=1241979 RepID=UPI0028B23BD6|nr:hypothetical protein [Kaistella carnis]
MKPEIAMNGVLGLGKESTAHYINQIHENYHLVDGGYSTCPMMVYQIDFQEINPYLPNDFPRLIPKMELYINQLVDLGITKLLIPNITLHETLDQIDLPITLCHPITLTTKYLKENQISEVYLFGTKYTMNSEYIPQKFGENGIKVKTPHEEDQVWLDEFRTSIYEKNQTHESISTFQNMISKYGSKSPVIIACTELSIYSIKENPSCIDMMDLQINEFLK